VRAVFLSCARTGPARTPGRRLRCREEPRSPRVVVRDALALEAAAARSPERPFGHSARRGCLQRHALPRRTPRCLVTGRRARRAEPLPKRTATQAFLDAFMRGSQDVFGSRRSARRTTEMDGNGQGSMMPAMHRPTGISCTPSPGVYRNEGRLAVDRPPERRVEATFASQGEGVLAPCPSAAASRAWSTHLHVRNFHQIRDRALHAPAAGKMSETSAIGSSPSRRTSTHYQPPKRPGRRAAQIPARDSRSSSRPEAPAALRREATASQATFASRRCPPTHARPGRRPAAARGLKLPMLGGTPSANQDVPPGGTSRPAREV